MKQTVSTPYFKALLLDEHLLFLQGLNEIFKKIAPESEIYFCNSMEKTKERLMTEDYQFLLMDLLTTSKDTKSFILYCRQQFPGLRLIIVSGITDTDIIKEYFSTGIHGYLSKSVDSIELKNALDKTYSGERYISSDLSGPLLSSFFAGGKKTLTKKELQILQQIASGSTVDKTSAKLNISPYTVMAHRRNIMNKLNLHSAGELVKYAFENNLQ